MLPYVGPYIYASRCIYIGLSRKASMRFLEFRTSNIGHSQSVPRTSADNTPKQQLAGPFPAAEILASSDRVRCYRWLFVRCFLAVADLQANSKIKRRDRAIST